MNDQLEDYCRYYDRQINGTVSASSTSTLQGGLGLGNATNGIVARYVTPVSASGQRSIVPMEIGDSIIGETNSTRSKRKTRRGRRKRTASRGGKRRGKGQVGKGRSKRKSGRRGKCKRKQRGGGKQASRLYKGCGFTAKKKKKNERKTTIIKSSKFGNSKVNF